jgi:hypothetical protein
MIKKNGSHDMDDRMIASCVWTLLKLSMFRDLDRINTICCP